MTITHDALDITLHEPPPTCNNVFNLDLTALGPPAPDMLKLTKLGLRCTGILPAPTPLYRDPPASVVAPLAPIMFKLVLYEARMVGTWVVGIPLEFFLIL